MIVHDQNIIATILGVANRLLDSGAVCYCPGHALIGVGVNDLVSLAFGVPLAFPLLAREPVTLDLIFGRHPQVDCCFLAHLTPSFPI